MIRTELLAPARDLECGIAAVNSGADAVYIGGTAFSARSAAATPPEEIERLCLHAHKYFCRVYLALNTLLRDNEIGRAVELARASAECGVDGLIIQDMGLIDAGLPKLPLIASTQCHNDTPEKILFLEKAGFSRVILPRELSLGMIAKIRESSTVELESFVHGSLCWAWSGRCWLSFALGGRSGNRGECGQPCRLPWTLQDADGKALAAQSHILSLKDLNLTGRLSGLLDAGVTSFKIEGRLKGPDYVKNITAHYRIELDKLLAGKRYRRSSSGTVVPGFTPDPARTFNRGYTGYFIDGVAENAFAGDTPKMKGSFLCKVSGSRRDGFETDAAHDLRPGDGLCWFDGDGILTGSTVVKISGARVLVRDPSGLRKGTAVYRNFDSAFMAALEKSKPRRTVSVFWTVRSAPGGVTVAARDEDFVEVQEVLADKTLRLPENPEKAVQIWTGAFSRLGGTEFRSEGIRFEGTETPFVPVSRLNGIRRQLVDSLRKARTSRLPGLPAGEEDPSWPYPERELTFEAGILNYLAEKFN